MTKQIEGLVERLRNFDSDHGERPLAGRDLVASSLMDEAADYIESMRSGVVDEAGLREILAQECKAAGAWMGAADLRNNHSCDVPHNAAISAMRRVSKTDEGRNAVSDATVTAALAAFNASVNEPQMVKGAGYLKERTNPTPRNG